MKKKRYEDGGDIDYDKDSDPEAQKVYRSDLTEISDSERMPVRASSKPAKRSTRKDDGSYDRKEQRRGMFSGFGTGKQKVKSKFSEKVSRGEMPSARDLVGFKKGGSIGSASRRADGIASRGKTKGRLV